jgi:hypothetical protein
MELLRICRMSRRLRIEVSPGRWTRLRLADRCGCGITSSGSALTRRTCPRGYTPWASGPRTWLAGLGRPRQSKCLLMVTAPNEVLFALSAANSLVAAGLALGHVFGTATRSGPLRIAYSCTRRRREPPKPEVRLRRSAGVCPGDERRVWDSNPRGSSRPLAVFKTAAIGH